MILEINNFKYKRDGQMRFFSCGPKIKINLGKNYEGYLGKHIFGSIQREELSNGQLTEIVLSYFQEVMDFQLPEVLERGWATIS